MSNPGTGDDIKRFQERFSSLKAEVGKVLVGQEDMLHKLLLGFLAGGHVLLEGVPGLAKTMVVRTLADAVDGTFSRIQFTPDMLPGAPRSPSATWPPPAPSRWRCCCGSPGRRAGARCCGACRSCPPRCGWR